MNDRIDVARMLAANGHFRRAVDVLRELVEQDPNQDAPRIALAELYRDGGYPDQAGRWGALVPGWPTDRELRLFARSFHPEVGRERIAAVLQTTVERVPTELIELVRASGRSRTEPTAAADRESVAVGVAVLAILIVMFGGAIVFVDVVLGIGDPTTWARIVALSFGYLGALSCSLWSISSVAKRRWRSAAISSILGLALFLLACWLVAVQIAR